MVGLYRTRKIQELDGFSFEHSLIYVLDLIENRQARVVDAPQLTLDGDPGQHHIGSGGLHKNGIGVLEVEQAVLRRGLVDATENLTIEQARSALAPLECSVYE